MPAPRLAFIGSPRDTSPWLLQAINRVGTLEALCTEDAERETSRCQARWAYSDLGLLLKETRPDGAILQLPADKRANVIKQCLSGGVGVLLTGMAGGVAASQRIDTLARLAGRCVLATTPLRFAPAIMLARRLLDSGKFGKPVAMAVQSNRRGDHSIGITGRCSIHTDQIFELVDLVQHLLGPTEKVFAVAHPEGSLVATLVTDSGIPVSASLHNQSPAESVGTRLEMRASDGNTLTVNQNCRLCSANSTRADALHGFSLAAADPTLELGYEGMLAEFRARIEAGPGIPGGHSGQWRPVIETCEAILASITKGRHVAVGSRK